MRYPIAEEDMINECKKHFAAKGLEFNQNDEDYIHGIVRLLNKAYTDGVQEGVSGKQ